MKCDDLLKMLNDYVDGDIDPSICDQFEDHLAGCNPCRVVIDNIRQTITLYRDDSVYEFPTEFQEIMQQTLEGKWKAKFGQLGS